MFVKDSMQSILLYGSDKSMIDVFFLWNAIKLDEQERFGKTCFYANNTPNHRD